MEKECRSTETECRSTVYLEQVEMLNLKRHTTLANKLN